MPLINMAFLNAVLSNFAPLLNRKQSNSRIVPTSKYLTMVFDLDLIKKVYREMPTKVQTARNLLGRPMTLAEKILYSHLLSLRQRPTREARTMLILHRTV